MLELSLTSSLASEALAVLSIALVLAFVLSALAVIPLLTMSFRLSHRAQVGCAASFALLTTLQIIAWRLYLGRQSSGNIELWFLAVALASGALVSALVSAQPLSGTSRRSRALFMFAILSLIELGGLAKVTELFANYEPSITYERMPGTLVVAEEYVGVTDQGTQVKMFIRETTEEAFQRFINQTRQTIQPVAERAMLRAAPSVQTNCCGWVFSGGRYIVRCEDVQAILDENGYQKVDKPQLGDVVVYRNSEGLIMHVGIVNGSMAGDLVLVESKWGADGTYVHLADEQPYSRDITYWHSERHGHVLRLVPAQSANVPSADSAAPDASAACRTTTLRRFAQQSAPPSQVVGL